MCKSVHNQSAFQCCYEIRHWEAHDIPASTYEHAVRLHSCLYEVDILSAKESVAGFAMALQGWAYACMTRLQSDRHSCLHCLHSRGDVKGIISDLSQVFEALYP